MKSKTSPGLFAITASMALLCGVTGCANPGFTEHKKETLPDGTVHEYDEPLPLWMQIASVAQLFAQQKGDPNAERDHPGPRLRPIEQ